MKNLFMVSISTHTLEPINSQTEFFNHSGRSKSCNISINSSGQINNKYYAKLKPSSTQVGSDEKKLSLQLYV